MRMHFVALTCQHVYHASMCIMPVCVSCQSVYHASMCIIVYSVSLSKSGKMLETFLSNLQDGEYDSPISKAKVLHAACKNWPLYYIRPMK